MIEGIKQFFSSIFMMIDKKGEIAEENKIIFEGHFAGRYGEYYHMEKMTNLDKLPAFGFRVICLPIKTKGASAGWVRAVALIDE